MTATKSTRVNTRGDKRGKGNFAELVSRSPLSGAAGTLASLLARATPGLQFNEHMDEADGGLVFAH